MRVLDGRRRGRSALAIGIAVTVVAGIACSPAGGNSNGAPGVTADQVVLGTSSGLTGAAGSFAVALHRGTEAWFKKVNAEGGVHGRAIDYVVLDDALEVSRAILNVRTLIRKPVFAVVGGTGAGSVVPMAETLDAADVPYLFPPTGKPEFADQVMSSVFALLPTFSDQAAALASWSAEKFGTGSYYLMTAETTDQDEQAAAAEKAVKAAGGRWLGSTVVPIGTADVTPYALKAAAGRPDYIIMTTAPADGIKIINALTAAGRLPAKAFLGGTALPGQPLLDAIHDPAARSRIYALASSVPATDERAVACNASLRRYFPDQVPDGASVFGCAMAQATVAALESAGRKLTRDGLLRALESMSDKAASEVSTPLTFSTSSHRGLRSLPLLHIDGAQFKTLSDIPVGER
ncbi:ABC transporter substrate-binding protein [Prauserella flavalba]|uniref:ABC transporter substrate-binding protein n=1 Tax=Prauserella flavalba TaxID=1477506 RepID=UPI0036E07D6C